MKSFVALLIFLPTTVVFSNGGCETLQRRKWNSLSGQFTVRGRVLSNGNPQQGVRVSLQWRSLSITENLMDAAVTDSDGNFIISGSLTDKGCSVEDDYYVHFDKQGCSQFDKAVKLGRVLRGRNGAGSVFADRDVNVDTTLEWSTFRS
uniref:Uncharacterized protein n=1 Tax=Romanomermis culicivorax TaxID=13658 RepID=A0A915JT58_ROMCU